LFYPVDSQSLRQMLDRMLSEAADLGLPEVCALIVPHAGYAYSGPVAALAYRQLQGRRYRRVLLLAPSHYAMFQGVALASEEVFATPLGTVPIDPLVEELARRPPFFAEVALPAELPGWANSGFGRGAARERPHRWEHAIEVQLPFLQRVLADFTLIPALFGDVDPREAAEVLLEFIDGETLVVASSDLSHYLPQEEAEAIDRQTLRLIRERDVAAAVRAEACGRLPIATLLHIAREKGWRAEMLDYRTSGDTSGDYEAVVGYAAVAFLPERREQELEDSAAHRSARIGEGCGGAPGETPSAGGQAEQGKPWNFSDDEKRLLLGLAHQAVEHAVKGQIRPALDPARIPSRLRQPAACFVTLKRLGQLRGCIGTLEAKEPLYLAVMSRAENAAMGDPRFSPVQPEELPELQVDISVLSQPQPLQGVTVAERLSQLQPGRHGVVLRVGPYRATFLPQVWRHFPDRREFLEKLAEKAGLPPDAWQWPEAQLAVYEAEVFGDKDFPPLREEV
jgi:AmmeMemoRadiSam system protein B/AmmeMemoRadiSam system protein A